MFWLSYENQHEYMNSPYWILQFRSGRCQYFGEKFVQMFSSKVFEVFSLVSINCLVKKKNPITQYQLLIYFLLYKLQQSQLYLILFYIYIGTLCYRNSLYYILLIKDMTRYHFTVFKLTNNQFTMLNGFNIPSNLILKNVKEV